MELDDEYANAAYIRGAEDFPPMWAQKALEYRTGVRSRLDIPYGPGPRQKLDLFLPDGSPKGLFVFVHGGYWLKFDRSYWSHLAMGAVARGWAAAVPSYDLAPAVRIRDITRQIARAVQSAADLVDGPIVLSGHSAGGHLVARMASKGVLSTEVFGRLKHIAPISPVADLRPLMKTSMNAELGLDDAECAAESPVLLQPGRHIAVTVWVGAQERPAFLDQAQRLSKAWSCDQMIAAGKHHFDVIDALVDPGSSLCRVLFAD